MEHLIKYVDPDISLAEFLPPHFNGEVRQDRNKRGGGVMVAIRNTFIVEKIELPDINCETAWAKISLKNHHPLYIGAFYRAPCPVVFQCHPPNFKATKSPNLTRIERNSSLNWPMARKWGTKLEVMGQRIANFDLNRAFPVCNMTPVQFTGSFEIRHRAWSSLEEVPYCFSRWSI